MDIKKMLQHIDRVENRKALTESANMTITFSSESADEVGTMLDRLRGMNSGSSAGPEVGNMHNDMVKFRSALGPEEPAMTPGLPAPAPAVPGSTTGDSEMGGLSAELDDMGDAEPEGIEADVLPPEDEDDMDEWSNSPDEKYADHKFMTKDLAGGLNREKKQFARAQPGDNAMAVETLKQKLLNALNEKVKKAKPDFLDVDKDKNKKEPMKKAIADKKKVDEVSTAKLKSYAKAASGSSHPNSASNLSSRAAYAMGKDPDPFSNAGEKDDKKSATRSKYVGKAIDKISKESAQPRRK